MRRTVLTIVGIVLLLTLLLVLLNVCGREASAADRVRLNRISSSHLVVGSPQQLASRAGDCKRVEGSYVFENQLGSVLFRLTLRARWCYSNGKVTWVEWTDGHYLGNQPWNLWAWRYEQDPDTAGGRGMRYAFRRYKGAFGVDVAWYHHTSTPYVQITVRGDGTYRVGKGG